MSVTSRSNRVMSWCRILSSRSRAACSVTSGKVSTAERMEVRGLRISCATSAAKRSMASIRSDRVSVMLSSERARSPSSSSRRATSGREMERARDRRTRSAAEASRSTGAAISRLSRSEEIKVAHRATNTKGKIARRWAAMVASMSPASKVSTPSTALTFWIGSETDTTCSPLGLMRMSLICSPCSASETSLFSADLAWAWAWGLGAVGECGQGRLHAPRLWAGGRGRSSTRSAIR